MSDGRLFSATALALLGWGVFALGASRPWGYVPLLAAMTGFGAVALLKRERAARMGRGLSYSLISVCAAISLQLVPLPVGVVNAISPAIPSLAIQGTSAVRPLSIDPAATALGLTFVAALSLFFAGAVRTMGGRGARRLAAGLIGLGTLVAFVGIAEASHAWSGFYRAMGLPLPPDSHPHGPFSSRNHYAGWMLMALALTMGYLCAVVESRRARTTSLVVVLCAAVLMAVALVQTESRAGIIGLALAVITMSGLLMRRVAVTQTRIVIAGLMVLLLFTGVMVTGVHAVVDRFNVDSWATAHGRLPIWRQAAAIARDFPVAGSGFNTYQSIVRFYPTPELDEPYEGAHNDFLQLSIEGGMLVGLPVLATIAFLFRETRRRFREAAGDNLTRWLRVGAVVGMALVAAQETVDFSLQIPGNAALFAVLAAIAVHRAPPGADAPWAAHGIAHTS